MNATMPGCRDSWWPNSGNRKLVINLFSREFIPGPGLSCRPSNGWQTYTGYLPVQRAWQSPTWQGRLDHLVMACHQGSSPRRTPKLWLPWWKHPCQGHSWHQALMGKGMFKTLHLASRAVSPPFQKWSWKKKNNRSVRLMRRGERVFVWFVWVFTWVYLIR